MFGMFEYYGGERLPFSFSWAGLCLAVVVGGGVFFYFGLFMKGNWDKCEPQSCVMQGSFEKCVEAEKSAINRLSGSSAKDAAIPLITAAYNCSQFLPKPEIEDDFSKCMKAQEYMVSRTSGTYARENVMQQHNCTRFLNCNCKTSN